MYRIYTTLTDMHGTDTVEIGTAPTMDQARAKISEYFSYTYYEGVDSIDREAMANVRIDGSDEPVKLQAEQRLPDWAVGWCHYCGMPARGWSFFDVPACEQCGG